ncbi:hypothetical protein GGE07_004322 [Sinorhizobium terangae]|uniref:hypothetical protein n=1 Tax=Sinorhizobium terangae TaxID=110322 RepID=UPI0017B12FCF|nr:hypothetical protein [Sinorhizobium terangae]MBB4187653.1 hypothetical protein [Sinorhizobium terangae]
MIDRINPRAAPGLQQAGFHADRRDARLLQTRQGQALLILHRMAWNDLGPITTVRVAFQPGHCFGAGEGRDHGANT